MAAAQRKSKPRRAGKEWLKQDGPNHLKYFDEKKRKWQRIEHDGQYADGGGLLLQVTGEGANKSWVFRYEVTGRVPPERRKGLGSLNDVTLTQARDEARRLRNMRATDKSVDPIEIEKAEKEAKAEQAAQALRAKAKERTVRQVVDGWIEFHRKGLEPEWPDRARERIDKFVYREKFNRKTEEIEPLPGMKGIGDLPIKKLEMAHGEQSGLALDFIHEILMQPVTDKNKRDDVPGPLWDKLTRTGVIVQQLIKGFIGYAINRGYISGINVASMEEGAPLTGRLKPWKSFHKIAHHAALKRERVAEFMAALRGHKDTRGWGKCPVCVSPHCEEIEAIYYNSIVPAREAENKRAAALGQAPYLKGGFGFGYKNLCKRFGINEGNMWQHFNGHPQQKSKEYPERPLSTYALEFIILTGVRKRQTLEVEWDDIKFEKGLQVCPGVREETGKQGHKMGKKLGDHVIVLSNAAMDVLREIERLQLINGTKGKYVFPKMGDASKHMSKNTINTQLKRYFRKDFPDITIHGFRTTYQSWSLSKVGNDRLNSELTLGHSFGGMATIYGRDADRIEERRIEMNDWADFCGRSVAQKAAFPILTTNQTKETTHEQDRSTRTA
jgi:hypothetical protein